MRDTPKETEDWLSTLWKRSLKDHREGSSPKRNFSYSGGGGERVSLGREEIANHSGSLFP